MKNLFLTYLILNSFFCLAQERNLILTEKENELWFESLKGNIDHSNRIDIINQRLKSDINVYINWTFPDGIKIKNISKLDSLRKSRIEGFCKPLFILKYKSKQIAFRFENPINGNKTDSVAILLNSDNIKNINIWTDDRKLIYGTSGNCGIIFLETSKRKVFSEIEKLKLTNNYMDEIMSY